jgi:hypothetical protein
MTLMTFIRTSVHSLSARERETGVISSETNFFPTNQNVVRRIARRLWYFKLTQS